MEWHKKAERGRQKAEENTGRRQKKIQAKFLGYSGVADSRYETLSEQNSVVIKRLTQALRTQGMQAKISVRGDRLHIGLNIAKIKNQPSAVAHIYTTLESLLNTDEPGFDLPNPGKAYGDRSYPSPSEPASTHFDSIKTVYVYGLISTKKVKWKQSFAMPQHRTLSRDDMDLMSFKNRQSNALMLPLVTVLALILNANPITIALLNGIHIWIHEFGHATVAWLSGYKAIPLPFGWTNTSLEQSLFVYFGVLTLLALLGWSGYRENRRWPIALAIALALLQLVMTWIVPDNTYRMLMAFSGIGGEFYLSTLLLVSFYFPLPDYWQWEFWRYPVAIAAAYTFWHIWGLWRQIDQGIAAIPWGSLWGGMGDANGDMNTLTSSYGWSDQRIIGTYTTLGDLCLFILIGLYLWIVIRQNRALIYRSWQRLLAQVM
ncbi:MAG: hypothetical protein AAGD25_20970 [Cyanobacteria bacterium P01_F01_bin.150]